MKYEVVYEAIDGQYCGTYDTLKEANEAFAFTLTMYNLVPLFKMYLIEFNTYKDYKVIKSFENMKINNKIKIMEQAHYSATSRRMK